MQDTIGQIVRKLEEDYTNGNTTISKYVDHDMYETLNKIDAYMSSVHTSGSQDSIGRDKPFFNIVTAARNVWFRATDIDRKHIKIKAAKIEQYLITMAAQMKLRSWMKKAAFGVFLNEWGRTLATYGSAVTKFVEKDGELIASVVPWNRIICDPIDFDASPKIEVLEFTPAQLRKQKGYDQEMVKQLLQDLQAREDLNKQKKDNRSNYIRVYEIHDEFSVAQYKESKGIEPEEGDENIFKQQMHVISFVGKSGRGRKTEYQDYTLYSGYEKKNPYLKDDLITEDGRTLGIGAVEHLFEAQWMVNHSAKQIKDTLDFASLMILQTGDGSLVGRNVLNSLITGDVLVFDKNQDPNGLQQVNNAHDITQIQAFSSQWQNLAKEITATPDAIRGNTQPSGTAYRLQQLITNESHSLFELMTENKGLAIERMFREFVLPYIKTQLDTSEEITDILDSQGITQFDSIYIPREATKRRNKKLKDQILSGEIADDVPEEMFQQDIKKEMSVYGNQRSMTPSEVSDKTWKEVLKGFEWEVEVDVTHESEDVNEAIISLATTFQTIASMAGRPMTADERLVFNQIMEKSGAVSPLQLTHAQTAQPNVAQQPPSGGRPTAEINVPAMAEMLKQ